MGFMWKLPCRYDDCPLSFPLSMIHRMTLPARDLEASENQVSTSCKPTYNVLHEALRTGWWLPRDPRFDTKMADDSTEKTPLIRNNALYRSEPQLTGCGATVCCDPRRNLHRYFVLGLICFLSFGKSCHSKKIDCHELIAQAERNLTE